MVRSFHLGRSALHPSGILRRAVRCREGQRRSECRILRIILSIQFAAVRLYDSADSIQTKTVMPLADFPKRLTAPIVDGQVKSGFRLLERKEELIVIYFSSRNQHAIATIVPKSIGKKFDKRFLQKLRIDIQHRVADVNVPSDFRSFVREVAIDFLTKIFHEI